MKKFRIVEKISEIQYKDRFNIHERCTDEEVDCDPTECESFENEEEAFKAFEKYKTSIYYNGKYYEVKEFYLEEIEFDEDDNILNCELLANTKMIISVDRDYEEMATFNNLKDAEYFKEDYERDHKEDDEEMIMMNGIRISFHRYIN